MLLKDFMRLLINHPSIYILSIENEKLYNELKEYNVDELEIYNILPHLGTLYKEIQDHVLYNTKLIDNAKIKHIIVNQRAIFIFIGLSCTEFLLTENEINGILKNCFEDIDKSINTC